MTTWLPGFCSCIYRRMYRRYTQDVVILVPDLKVRGQRVGLKT